MKNKILNLFCWFCQSLSVPFWPELDVFVSSSTQKGRDHTCRDTKSSFLYLFALQLIEARFPHFSRFLRENLHTHIHRTEGQILASLLWVVLFQGILVQTIQNPTDLAVSGSWWNLMQIKRQHNKSVVHINWQFSHWRLTINMLCCRSSFWDWQFL